MTDRLPVQVGLGIGLVAGSVLALQVLLTRLFSAELFYHFTFLTISLALLGAGAGAITVYVRPRWFRRPLRVELARWSIALAGLLIVVPLVLAHLNYTSPATVTGRFAFKLAVISAVCTLVFAAGGIVIALAVRAYAANMSRLYAFDLVGAALGSIVVVPLMWHVSVPILIVATGPVGAIAALLFARGSGPRMSRAAIGAVGLGLVAIVLASTTSVFDPEPANEATLGKPASDRWTPLGRVVAYKPGRGSPFEALFYDRGGAPVARYRRGGPIPNWRQLGLGAESLGFVFGGTQRALIIGGGGGRDILNALSSGVRRVDVIELNQQIINTVDGPLRSFSAAPYTLPGVHSMAGDGRSNLAHSNAKYNVINIGNADTLTANSAEGYVLTENFLYTTQAVNEYLDHLLPGGVLDMTRPRRLVGDEALRLTVLALQALQDRGVSHPQRNVAVVLGDDPFAGVSGTVLVRLRPWTPAELARLRVLAKQRGLGVAYAPGGPYQLEWASLARARSPQAFCSSFKLNVCAPTDHNPYFFEMRRFGSFGSLGPGYIYAADPFLVLLVTVAILLVLSAVLVAAPLVLTARQDRPPASALGFFAAIGFGFLGLEVTLIDRFELFLGFPTYALSVVLFALLLWTGIGALLAGRVQDPRRALTAALGVSTLLMAASAFWLRPLLADLIDLPFAARVAVTVALLAPAGIGLGMAMPLGLGRLVAFHPRGVAWAWGVNGFASVVASAAAVAISIISGFPAATLVSVVCYLGALAHVRLSAWPQRKRVSLEHPLAPTEPEPVLEL